MTYQESLIIAVEVQPILKFNIVEVVTTITQCQVIEQLCPRCCAVGVRSILKFSIVEVVTTIKQIEQLVVSLIVYHVYHGVVLVGCVISWVSAVLPLHLVY